MDYSLGHVTPASYIPHEILPWTGEMTFFQRVYNVFLTAYDLLLRRYDYLPSHNKLVRKYFHEGIPEKLPDVASMEKEISLVLVNSHRVLEMPRPRMPAQINVGFAHILRAYVLPKDLKVSALVTVSSLSY